MGITFKNMYNDPPKDGVSKGNVPAIAASVKGDKTAFYKCAFKGVQDTLFDQSGRHYFYKCYIQGEIDFIFGNGQSIYEKCVINLVGGPDGPQGLGGYITAQARNSENDTSGFVFKYCTIEGVGKVFLGRAYRAYSRVIFTDSYLSPSIDPQGWSAWDYSGHEGNITFVEEGCRGAGANKSKRVPWLKHMGPNELIKFKSQSFIDRDGWIPKQPITNKDI
ncbi:putative pectinesterase 66 [Senna tora]|uniref:pectinesterase n=1 Tax=Senna tora TaxID=362788 RepID=A0A834WGD1_9FABA|nr:putative pectinesterase 66 [Senna tora]